MNKSLTTAGLALALGVVWTAGPALAQSTTGEKIENKAERAGDKMERAADKTGDKLERAADKAEDKAERAGDKAESKMERTKDKARDLKNDAKDKTTELKNKAKAKMDRMEAKANHQDVAALQQALKDKGYDPGPMDGVMGPRTKAALMEYQRAEGMTATGRWDAETAAKLGVRSSMNADKDTINPAASPQTGATTPSGSVEPTRSTPPGVSTVPPKSVETAPPGKRNAP